MRTQLSGCVAPPALFPRLRARRASARAPCEPDEDVEARREAAGSSAGIGRAGPVRAQPAMFICRRAVRQHTWSTGQPPRPRAVGRHAPFKPDQRRAAEDVARDAQRKSEGEVCPVLAPAAKGGAPGKVMETFRPSCCLSVRIQPRTTSLPMQHTRPRGRRQRRPRVGCSVTRLLVPTLPVRRGKQSRLPARFGRGCSSPVNASACTDKESTTE